LKNPEELSGRTFVYHNYTTSIGRNEAGLALRVHGGRRAFRQYGIGMKKETHFNEAIGRRVFQISGPEEGPNKANRQLSSVKRGWLDIEGGTTLDYRKLFFLGGGIRKKSQQQRRRGQKKVSQRSTINQKGSLKERENNQRRERGIGGEGGLHSKDTQEALLKFEKG